MKQKHDESPDQMSSAGRAGARNSFAMQRTEDGLSPFLQALHLDEGI
jgi:hypothetical protein